MRRDTSQVQVSHAPALTPVFDDPNLVSAAGVASVMRLADAAGLASLLDEQLTLPSPNRTAKARTVIAGMLAGADDIDGMDILRSGGMKRLLAGVRAPSTIGTFLRKASHGHVLQLAAVNRALVEGLACHVPGLIGPGGPVLVDLDDTIGEVHGYRKQGAAYGYSGVKGLNAMVAAVSTDQSAPVISDFGLRRGNARSGDNADWYLSRTLRLVGAIAPNRDVLVRADSAFCTYDTIAATVRSGAWFSVTIPSWRTVTDAIGGIPDDAWEPIEYPDAIWDADAGGWVSDAEVAEAPFTAFTSRKKDERVRCRLVIRRVKRLNPRSRGQDALFDTYRYHAFITNSSLDTVTADRRHRGHAIIEQVIAELKDGPLAHLPSGVFQANAAWIAFGVIAFNLSRAAAHAAGIGKARMRTIRDRIIRVPARLATRARKLVIHLPARWPWQQPWMRLWEAATGPPGAGII
nr:IS1380 family transposase [Microbacterium lacticum]